MTQVVEPICAPVSLMIMVTKPVKTALLVRKLESYNPFVQDDL
jgi:hypothetical protein